MYGSAFTAFCELKKVQGKEPKNFTEADMCHWSWFHAGWSAPSHPSKDPAPKEEKEYPPNNVCANH
jgi:hypothetical protein